LIRLIEVVVRTKCVPRRAPLDRRECAVAREVAVVQLVRSHAHDEVAAVEGLGGDRRITDAQVGLAVEASQPIRSSQQVPNSRPKAKPPPEYCSDSSPVWSSPSNTGTLYSCRLMDGWKNQRVCGSSG
jgi:hypothetical protein